MRKIIINIKEEREKDETNKSIKKLKNVIIVVDRNKMGEKWVKIN
jgi:hypothetical protein